MPLEEFVPNPNKKQRVAHKNGFKSGIDASGLLMAQLFSEAKLESDRKANHDPLTGLLSEIGFYKMLDARINQANEGELAVFYIDIKDFKKINDTLGHSEGDALLQRVSVVVADGIRHANGGPGDNAARFHGDEFVFIIDLTPRAPRADASKELTPTPKERLPEERLVEAGNRIRTTFTQFFAENLLYSDIDVSIGGAVYLEGMNAQDLVQAADAEMFVNKREQQVKDGSYR